MLGHRRPGEGVPLPAGAARIVPEGDLPLDDDDGAQQPAAAAARHPDEEVEAELAAADASQQRQSQQLQAMSDDDEPDAAWNEEDEEAAAAAAAAAAAGRLSPPPVSAEELASGELEVVSAEEDRRMVELLRTQVGPGSGRWVWAGGHEGVRGQERRRCPQRSGHPRSSPSVTHAASRATQHVAGPHP
jgi:hypothetical protein